MKENIKISVVIPVYNGARWVSQSIENVLRQSYKNLEVIVVDDGSTDATGEIAASYPVKLITQANSGPAVARNAGLDASTGDYIHFLDVDDLINLHYYERLAEAAELTRADIALGGIVSQDKNAFTLRFSETSLLVDLEDKEHFTKFVGTCAVWRYIVRRDFLTKLGLRFEDMTHEDLPFTLRAFPAANAVVTVPGTVYYYMQRSGSIMNPVAPEAKQRIDEANAGAEAMRRDFIEKHGLRRVSREERTVETFKILGIPGLKKVTTPWRAKWYLWGVRIVRDQRLA